MAEAAVPIRESVGAALRFVRENLRFIAIVAAIGAIALTAAAGIGLAMPLVSFLFGVLQPVQAFAYAAFLSCLVFGAGAVRGRWTSDGARMWGAMLIVGFFLVIVFVVLFIPATIALAVGPLAPYLGDLQVAGQDQAAVMAVMTSFAEENPLALLLFCLFFVVVWLLLTSRLYLAAPATVEQGRVLTFETWKWTKGATLRITAARLILLLPANILTAALGYLAGRAVGIDALDPATAASVAQANPAGYLAYVLVSSWIVFALYASLEAGLSTYLYRGLKPADAPPAA